MTDDNLEFATLGGGCFWCIEAVFEQLKGVDKVESGYAGGHVKNPSYEEVCGKKTGHAEVIQIQFNPQIVTYKEILEIFFTIHDPTTLNRQGNDVGPQYRSIILYHSENQKKTAEETIKFFEEKKIWNKPIVTELKEADEFFVAEDYHQGYYRQNKAQPYCQYVIAPKVAKFRKEYFSKLRK